VKGAFLISDDSNLFRDARAVLLKLGAKSSDDSGGVAQLRDEAGRLFTIFGRIPAESEWEVREGPFEVGSGSGIPDMATVTACAIECRWEDLFATVVGRIAAQLPGPCWDLAGNGVVWAADSLDSERLHL
jgi:hypothetical protein